MALELLNRRAWLRSAVVGLGAGSMSGWMPTLCAAAAPPKRTAVILLWLSGGPSTIDLWDLKPGHDNGGPFREIETGAPGLRVSEHLSRVAPLMNDAVVVRSMTSKEGDHDRATHLARTGYVPQASIQFPALGALVTHEAPSPPSPLPSFVSIAPARAFGVLGGGFLGPNHAPLVIGEGAVNQTELTVPNLARRPNLGDAEQIQRLEALRRIDSAFARRRSSAVVDSMRSASQRAELLMRPEAVEAFQIDREAEALRDVYGRGLFGQGCLLARRLVERGVSFVEVTLDGWDTHSENFPRVAALAATLDAGMSSLIGDLKQRGMIDSTLVICMGEFGRTPKINGSAGRDHHSAAWSAMLAGGGLNGGRAIGATSPDGMNVVESPITPPDLLATICTRLGIDPRKQNMSNVSRPIRVADPEATIVQELL